MVHVLDSKALKAKTKMNGCQLIEINQYDYNAAITLNLPIGKNVG